jgi:hypothetical protein
MKVKTISRLKPKNPTIQRNLDQKLHPFAQVREATRALVAAKWDRIFAKPFVGLQFITYYFYCVFMKYFFFRCTFRTFGWNLVTSGTPI